MNKAKAAFAAVIIAVVAGATGVCWYLNDSGIIGGGETTDPAAYVQGEADDLGEGENSPGKNNDGGEDNRGEDKTENGESAEVGEVTQERITEINEFLSSFSKVYFSESSGYADDDYSVYEVIKFAYSYIKMTEPSDLVSIQMEDEIGSYRGVTIDDVNEVLNRFLGISVREESVRTENKYAFFLYEDGFFYTPAADGIGYSNLICADSVEISDGEATVSFTVYSSGVTCSMTSKEARSAGERYAEGEAVLEISDSGYTLKSYSIEK